MEAMNYQNPSPAPSEDSDVAQLLPVVPEREGEPTVKLGVLLDFTIQQALHELTILSEMLPIKDPTDRKKAIVQFAHATRLMFAKMLAVVKWLRTSKKFEPLSSICYFLDQQAQQFVDTADKLFNLAHVELQQARLPLFQVSTAIDVLTTGTYPRLPLIIKDAFVSEDKLTPYETRQTILLLNERLVYYLVKAAPTLPSRVSMFRVHNGTIVMRVKGEFQVRITVLPREKPEFVLLSVAILVKDSDIGAGMDLVHPLQINSIHECVQSRMAASNQPFLQAYQILHTFALSLQLDVLECQTRKLMTTIASNYVCVEHYDPYRGTLDVRYWIEKPADQTEKRSRPAQNSRLNKLLSNSVTYKMHIFTDKEDMNAGLFIRHSPPSAVKLIDHVPTKRQISMGQLLSEVIEVRIRERLLLVRQVLSGVSPTGPVHFAGDAAPTLIYEVIVHEKQSSINEHLHISINAFYGHVVCQCHVIGQHEDLRALEKEFNGGCAILEVSKIISRLRIAIMMERYRAALAVSQCKIVDEKKTPAIVKLSNFPSDRFLLQFQREREHLLAIGFTPSLEHGVDVEFRLITKRRSNLLNAVVIDPVSVCNAAVVPLFYNVNASENNVEANDAGIITGREIPSDLGHKDVFHSDLMMESTRARSGWTGSVKQVKLVVSAIDDRLVFLRVAEALESIGVKVDPVQMNDAVGGPFLRITDFSSIPYSDFESYANEVVSVVIRADNRRSTVFTFETTLRDIPLRPNFIQNQAMGQVRFVPEGSYISKVIEHENTRLASDRRTFMVVKQVTVDPLSQYVSDSIRQKFLDQIFTHSHLYEPVKRFAHVYHRLEKDVDIVSYNLDKLVIAYGPERVYRMAVEWCPKKELYGLYFSCHQPYQSLNGSDDFARQSNPHNVVNVLLTERYNKMHCLIDLVHFLVNSIIPLRCLTEATRGRVRSLKTYCSVAANDPSKLHVGLDTYMYSVYYDTLRIVVGRVTIEVVLLNDSAVLLTDVSPNAPLAPGLLGLVNAFEDYPVNNTQDIVSSYDVTCDNGTGSKSRSKKIPCDLRPPGSLPPGQAEIADLMRRLPNPRSVPNEIITQRSAVNPVASESNETEENQNHLNPSRTPVHVSCRRLVRLCTNLDGNGLPFENYLNVISFVSRVGEAVAPFANTDSMGQVPLRNIIVAPALLSISATTMNIANKVGLVTLRCYMCPKKFTLRTILIYEHVDSPSNAERMILYRYFEKYVSPLYNERAVIAFLNLCRVTLYHPRKSLLAIMEAQMNPTPDALYLVSLHLTPIIPPSNSQAVAKALGALFTFNDICLIFNICISPAKISQKERFDDRRYFEVAYYFTNNTVSIKVLFSKEETADVRKLIEEQTERARQNNECPLWPCINAFVKTFNYVEAEPMDTTK